MNQPNPPFKSNKKFDIVTAFQYFETLSHPLETIEEMVNLLKPGGKLLFITFINDVFPNIKTHGFLSPRNGRVCLFSDKSLITLFEKFDMKVWHKDHVVHAAMKK
jgi:SAM-dependent methyltransferase